MVRLVHVYVRGIPSSILYDLVGALLKESLQNCFARFDGQSVFKGVAIPQLKRPELPRGCLVRE